MKKFVVASLLVLMVSSAFGHVGHAYRIDGDLEIFSLLNTLERNQFVALGTVQLLTAQYRENINEAGSDMICTDVLFRIETLIKGTPNFGDNHHKFIYEGGTAYHPAVDEVITQDAIPNVRFEVGEKVLIFLRSNDDPAFIGFPYGYHVDGIDYGKKLVNNGLVYFLYNKGTSHANPRANVTPVEMTADFAKTLALAYMDDKEGAKDIEATIKTVARNAETTVTLTAAQETTMKTKAQRIIDAAKAKETK